MLPSTWGLMVDQLQLKDGDIVVLRSKDSDIFKIADAYFAQEGAKKVHFWFLRNHESLRVLTEEDKACLRRQLDG